MHMKIKKHGGRVEMTGFKCERPTIKIGNGFQKNKDKSLSQCQMSTYKAT